MSEVPTSRERAGDVVHELREPTVRALQHEMEVVVHEAVGVGEDAGSFVSLAE
jgi:hypothetical protein